MAEHTITIEQARARANARCDGMLERVQSDDSTDVLGLKRVRTTDRAPAIARKAGRRSMYMMPALRHGRPMNVARQRTLHVKFDKKKTTPAGYDRYISLNRDTQHAGAEPLIGENAPDVGAAGYDQYSVTSRIDPNADRPAEQIFTNMPGTSAERQVTWSKIEAHERSLHKQGPDRVNIKYELDPDFFLRVADQPECPDGLRLLIERERDRVAAGRKLSKQDAPRGVAYIADDVRDVEKRLKSMHHALRGHEGAAAPFKFSAGRAVQTHHRGDVELPKELDGPACRRVCVGLLEFLRRHASPAQRRVALRDGRLVEGDLPFITALHPPEANNHPDNLHFHFQFHDRAVAYEDDGTPAFAAVKCGLTHMGTIKAFRDECARLINVELTVINANFSVSGDSFEKLGIAATPQGHLGSQGMGLEAAGTLTSTNLANRVESWRRPFREIARQASEAMAAFEAEDTELWRRVDAAAGSEAEREARRSSHAVVRTTASAIVWASAEVAELELIIEMARSGPASAFEKNTRLAAAEPQREARHRAKRETIARELAMLDEDLQPERQALAASEARHSELVKTRQELVSRLRQELDHVSRPPTVVGPTPHRANAIERSPTAVHRAVDQLENLPIRIVLVGSLLQVNPADDRSGIAKGLDSTGPDIQARLAALRIMQQDELKICKDMLKKHGFRALSERVPGGTPYTDKVRRKWSASPAGQELSAAQYKADFKRKRARAAVEMSLSQLDHGTGGQVASAEIVAPTLGHAPTSQQLPARNTTPGPDLNSVVQTGAAEESNKPATRPGSRLSERPGRWRQLSLDSVTGTAPGPAAGRMHPSRYPDNADEHAQSGTGPSAVSPSVPEHSITAKDDFGVVAQSASRLHKAHAIVARIFHATDWSRADYGLDAGTPKATLQSLTTHVRTIADLPNSRQPDQRQPASTRQIVGLSQQAAIEASRGRAAN